MKNKIKDPAQKKPSLLKSRRFKSGGYAVLVSIVVILVVVAANLFVGQLPSTSNTHIEYNYETKIK